MIIIIIIIIIIITIIPNYVTCPLYYAIPPRGGGKELPYLALTDTCCSTGHGFQGLAS